MKPTKKPMNLTGQRFGKLTALKIAKIVPRKDPRQRTYYWTCRCDCGKQHVVSTMKLRRGQKSCGCSRESRLAFGQGFLNKLRQIYTRAARIRSLPFELSKEQFDEMVQTSCSYCGDSPKLPGKGYEHNFGVIPVTGVDRMNNTLGYTVSNCAPCCKQCNWAKNALSWEDWIEWRKRLAAFVK